MAKKTDSVRQFKGTSKKASTTTGTSNQDMSSSQQMQFVSYLLFLYNYIHFNKEDRNYKGEGILEDGVINLVSTHEAECYSLLVELGKDLKVLPPSISGKDSEFTSDRLKILYGKLFSIISSQPEGPNDKKYIARVKSFAETIRRETIDNMVKFLVNYKFNKCEGVNQTVLRINDLLVCLGRFLPILNVQLVESGILSGWLIRILKENTANAKENIEVYRLFATQWIHVIVSEYQMFRRRAKEEAMQKKQRKIEAKKQEIQSKRKKKQKQLEKRRRELAEKLKQMEAEGKKKQRNVEDDLFFDDDEDDDEEERYQAELEALEKLDDSGADNPIVRKIRDELFDQKFIKIACDILKSLPQYSDKDIIVIVSTDPDYNAETKISIEDHRHKCNALLYQELTQILKELLTSTYAFDDDLFDNLSASMVEQDLDSVFEFCFSDMENVNTARRAFNWLYFLLHNSNEDIRLKLVDHVYRVVEIFKGSVEEKNGKIRFKEETLSAACLYLLGYITGASKTIAKNIHVKYPEFFDILLELFKDRSFHNNVLCVLYGSISSLIRYAIDDNHVILLDERYQFFDEILTDVHTADSLLRYPGIVMTRILLERLANISIEKAAPLYNKIIDSKVGDVMLQTIFDKRFQNESTGKDPQSEMTRILHHRFLHPGSLCTLNVLLDQSSKTGNNEVNKSLFELVSSDDRYAEIIQFMRFMQQSKVKSFSYKYVFGLIGFIVLVVLLFPLLVKFFGAATP